MLVPKNLEKSFGLKPRKIALIGLPFPIEVAQVRPAMSQAILCIRDCTTACTIVQWAQLVMDPFAIGVVACYFCINPLFFCKNTKPEKILLVFSLNYDLGSIN